MTRTVKEVRIFISSPSDVNSERAAAKKVIDELNRTLCDHNGIVLKPLTWEDNTYSAVGAYSQDVINEQIGRYDLFVGIMATRFGTPTPNAGSGTEEEFNLAYKNREETHIMFFFDDRPIKPSEIDYNQSQKVEFFKKQIADKGLFYKLFNNDFEDVFRASLTKFLLDNYPNNDKNGTVNETVSLQLTKEFEEYINSTDTNFTHPSGGNLSFEDLYVPQNLRILTDANKNEKRTNIETLTEAIDIDGIHYHIIGGERSGKTALCKYVFRRYYYRENLTPILIKGSDLSTKTRKNDIIKIVTNAFKGQYEGYINLPTENAEENNDFVIIIDDFQLAAKGNDKYWKLLTSNIEDLFNHIIVLGDTSISTHDLSANPPFDKFDKFYIMEFGPDLRNQLVEKWNSFGQDNSIESKNSIRKKNDEANKNINSILGKNFIPAYPFYILGILQILEGIQNNNSINYSLHGFYYEHLINDGLIHSIKNQKDISFYYNFLIFFCYYLFDNNTKILTIDEFEEFYNSYCKKHDIDTKIFKVKKVKETLKQTKLLKFNNDVRVSQNYIYYFFVAKYIANHIEDDEIKKIVQKLCERIFKEEYANIIMFVTHLSKNNWIIKTLLENAQKIFPKSPICRLEKDIDPLNELMLDFPNRVLGVIDVDSERKTRLALETQLEEKQKEFDKDEMNYSQFSLDDDIKDINLFAQINLAVRMIDILGQIAIKYWGELTADLKYDILETAYNVGLRTLGLYLSLMSDNKNELAEYIAKTIVEKYSEKNYSDISLMRDEIEAKSLKYLANLSYLSSYAIITRVSSSVGDERLNKTFEKIAENNPYNSYNLINLSIDLNYPQLPIYKIETYSKKMTENIMCRRLLQDLVINHMYKFDVNYKDKSRIQSLLNIKVQDQVLIQNISQVKRK